MKHITRAVGVLVVIILLVFVVPRLIPASAVTSLEKFGFYKGKDNSQEWQQLPAKYADPVTCKTCHTQEHINKQPRHEPSFLGKHGDYVSNDKTSCFKCHGSERWCTNCHGLTMPHPKNIVKVHPGLVQGRPEVCARCHGTESCTRCHRQAGVKF